MSTIDDAEIKIEYNKHNIIYVCGPDHTGKTEISKALAQKINGTRFKASSEHETLISHADKFSIQTAICEPRQIDLITQIGAKVVFDRGWPCEFAYGNILERKVDLQSIFHIDELAYKANAIVIVCWRSSYKFIVDDLNIRLAGDMLSKIELEYRRLATMCKTPFIFVNVDDENLDREINDIVVKLNATNLLEQKRN
mgnify:FL=1